MTLLTTPSARCGHCGVARSSDELTVHDFKVDVGVLNAAMTVGPFEEAHDDGDAEPYVLFSCKI